MTQEQLIDEFINGAKEGVCSGGKNLKIESEKLIHYQTPIAERYKGRFIINVTRYSLVTGRLQKILCERIPAEKQIIVKRVKEGYRESLSDFMEDTK
jgi:hypothetical protein